MASILPTSRLGRFRKRPATIGGFFQLPAPVFLPTLMNEFCQDFPILAGERAKYDPIVTAARFSYRFVAIHPYSDGNGRVSRLLMNLILKSHGFPPIYLKADSRGKKRYSFALKRANRGSMKELASLIALAAIDVYKHLNKSLSRIKA